MSGIGVPKTRVRKTSPLERSSTIVSGGRSVSVTVLPSTAAIASAEPSQSTPRSPGLSASSNSFSNSPQNFFLEAVMDRLTTGALAVDAEGIVRAANRPAREYLDLRQDPRGTPLAAILEKLGVQQLIDTVTRLMSECAGTFEDLELPVTGRSHRLRISAQRLTRDGGDDVGSVILFKEVSHEPLRRTFEEIVSSVGLESGELRPCLERAFQEMGALSDGLSTSGISSPSMAELAERVSRTQTAIQNWLDVDDLLAREEYPDAQQLLDRMRLASQRWPYADELPSRVAELAATVEAYYESGENPGKRVL